MCGRLGLAESRYNEYNNCPAREQSDDQYGIAVAVQSVDPCISRRFRSEAGSYTPQGCLCHYACMLCAWGIFTWALVLRSFWIPSGLPPAFISSLPSFILLFFYDKRRRFLYSCLHDPHRSPYPLLSRTTKHPQVQNSLRPQMTSIRTPSLVPLPARLRP